MANILAKFRRVNLIRAVYIFFEFIAILLFAITILMGVIQFFYAIIYACFKPGDRVESLIGQLLTSFELFFLAPVSLLIISSFKAIIVKMYPVDVKVNRSTIQDMIQEIDAKKTFVSSLIGVTSTYILGRFIDRFSDASTTVDNLSTANFMYLSIGLLAFLVIQITLYAIISSHSVPAHQDENPLPTRLNRAFKPTSSNTAPPAKSNSEEGH